MRSALIPILLNSVPGWVRNAYPQIWPTMLAVAQYDQDRYWIRGRGQCSIADIQTCTRAQTVPSYVTTASGLLVPCVANQNRRSDLGDVVEPSAINLILQSQTLATSPWGESHGGAASAPTVTNAFGTAPDGTLTACRVQMALNGGITSSDRADWAQTVTVANATIYTLSFYIQSNTASTYAMQIGDSTTGTVSNISVSPTVARVSTQFTTGSTTATPRLRLRGGQTPTNSDSVDILVWGAQLEIGSIATSYIPTTTTSLTRNGDSTSLTAALSSLIPITTGTFIFNMGAVPWGADSVDHGLLAFTQGSTTPGIGRFSGGFLQLNDGVGYRSAQTYTNGVAFKYAVTLGGGAISSSLNGGAVSTYGSYTGSISGTGQPFKLGSGSGNSFWNGSFKSIAIASSQANNTDLQALAT